MSTSSVPHQPGRMADLISSTRPQPAVPRGRHRSRTVRMHPEIHLITLALGGMFAAAIYLVGGPW